MIAASFYRPGVGWEAIEDPTTISDHVKDKNAILWAHVDVHALGPADATLLAEEFGFDPLAVEDAVKMRQRPKLEPYESHLFAIAYELSPRDGHLDARQISCFIGPGFVVVLHDGASATIDEANKRILSSVDPTTSTLVHHLLDTVVDRYQTIADALETEIEQIEDLAFENPRAPLQHELYSVKKRLAQLRRYAVPGERILAVALEPNRSDLITQRTAASFRDVHDHMQRIIDQLAHASAVTDAVLELQRSEQAHSLNDVTKRLTGWAAIIAVPTLIASIYGMNFALIPDEGSIAGFTFAVSAMAVASVSLFAFFKRRGWL